MKNMNLPNQLTIVRIILTPIFLALFLSDIKYHFMWGLIVFAIGSFTDFLDGKIARKFNQVSALGKVLDPVADKLTQITLAVLLYMSFAQAQDAMLKAFSWVFLVFIGKEAFMVVFSVFMLILNLRPCAAEIFGKLSTFEFYFIMIVIVAFGPEIGWLKDVFQLPPVVMMILVVVSAILTIVALISYIPDTVRQFKEKFGKK